MTAGIGRRLVESDVACGECGCTVWDVGILAGPAEPDGDGGAFVEVRPAPVARCAACGRSRTLDR